MAKKTRFCLKHTNIFYANRRNINKTDIDFRALKF